MGLIAPPCISLFVLLIMFAKGEGNDEILWRAGIIWFTLFTLWIGYMGVLLFTAQYKQGLLHKVIRYTVSYVLAAIVCMLIDLAVLWLQKRGVLILAERRAMNWFFFMVMQSAVMNTIVVVFQNFIILQDTEARIRLENSYLKIANIEAANQLLKQQIHPHFLFNALNTLKSLIKKYPVLAEDYLVKLSDFLRASVSSNSTGVVRLEEEIKLCLDYLDMQKIRLGEALQFTLFVPKEKLQLNYVPAFSLQPLLENAIKHNMLTAETPLQINIVCLNSYIVISNNVQQKNSTEPSTGSGLANLAERYKILCGDDIVIQAGEEIFSVRIPLLNDANNNHRR